MSKSRRCKSCNKSFSDQSNSLRIRRHGSCVLCGLDKQSVVDDTFNDDTPAQTFGGLDAGKMRLIGIHGPARAGKDTLCSYILDNLDDIWLRSSFADPIKRMLEVIGVDCSDEAKAVIDERFCYTPRHMMQILGTEWGREMIHGNIWVDAFARLNAGKCVIVPDVRFENEAELVREHGVLIHLVGRGGIEGNHASENAIAFKPGDIVIDNSRDLAWLHGQVDGNAVLGEFIAKAGDLLITNKKERTVDKDIKKGLWRNNTHGRCIEVKKVGLTIIGYSNEGCSSDYSMGVSELLNNYELYEAE